MRKREKYSAWNLLRRAYFGAARWGPAWRSAEPRGEYDVVIVGGGGHGLATAYYLASQHRVGRIAVLEKKWIGSGNTGRNTQAVRSNYFYPQSAAFFERSLVLYEGLSRQLNYNLMLSQRGVVTLAHSDHELVGMRRWCNAIRLHGIDSEMLAPEDIHYHIPLMQLSGHYPVLGAFAQWRGGIVRHDSVIWALARACTELGVDIVQGTEVKSIDTSVGRVCGVTTASRGRIAAGAVAVAAAGSSGSLLRPLGLDLPIVCSTLQAMVSEPVKPLLDVLVNSPTVHVYLSQSDHGEIVIGGSTDGYPSFSQRAMLPTLQANAAAAVQLFPAFAQLKILRQWAGVVDITPDASPIIGMTPVEGLYINAGWGTGGFKAIPAAGETLAATIATRKPHPLIAPFSLDRFVSGALIDEAAAAGVAH